MVEIVGDPVIARRADRIDPRLFDRIEHRARHRIARCRAGMERGVVVAHLEREAVGQPACLRHLVRRQRAGGHRHLDMLAGGDRRVGGEAQLHLRFLGNRARRAAQDVAKPVEWGFLCHGDCFGDCPEQGQEAGAARRGRGALTHRVYCAVANPPRFTSTRRAAHAPGEWNRIALTTKRRLPRQRRPARRC